MSAKKRRKNRPQPVPQSSSRWVTLVRVLLGVAALGAAYLAYVSLSNGPVAGCGGESGCNKVLQSRWAYWLGVPVSLPAVLVYLGLLGGTFPMSRNASGQSGRRAWMLVVALSIVVAGAAAWFIGLQVFVIKAFCKFCMTAHACGLTAAVICLRHLPKGSQPSKPDGSGLGFGLPRRALSYLTLVGVAGLAVLVAGQLAVEKSRNVVKPLGLLSLTNKPVASQTVQPVPLVPTNPPPTGDVTRTLTNRLLLAKAMMASNRLSAGTPGTGLVASFPSVPPTTNKAGLIAQRIAPNLLSVHDGAFQFKLDEVPILGSPQAPHLIVSLFDYTCHHCRQLHPFLVEAQRRLSNELAIVSLPMPMATNCNPAITHYFAPHAKACDYAKLGLAVWRANRQVSPQFDDWLFEPAKPVPVEEARRYAAQLVGADKLEQALGDPWILNMIHESGYLYRTNNLKLGNGMLPQLMIGKVASFGPLNSVQDLLKLLREHEGLR